MNKFRIFLEKNKIFIETLAAISLSVMAVVVSIQSNKIAEYQNELSKQQLLPKFDVSLTQDFFNQEKDCFTGEKITVYNSGSPFTNYHSDVESFIVIHFLEKETGLQFQKDILLKGYFGIEAKTSKTSQGKIREIYCKNCLIRFSKVDSIIRKEMEKKTDLSLDDVELKHYLKISYVSTLEDRAIKYYDVSFMEGQLMEAQEGEKIFHKAENYWKESMFITFSMQDSSCIKKINQVLNKKNH